MYKYVGIFFLDIINLNFRVFICFILVLSVKTFLISQECSNI